MSTRASAGDRRMRLGCRAASSGSLEDVTPPPRTTRRTTSMSSLWRNTRSALGVGHVWACSESVAARALQQKQVMLGVPRNRVGSPRRLRSAARNSESERVMLRAAGGASRHGGAWAGQAVEPCLRDLCIRGSVVQASEQVVVGCLSLVDGECALGRGGRVGVQGRP
jgi:hypothetical protein